jgi:hypothetical protein
MGCASSILHYEKAEQLATIEEFDQKVKIDKPAPTQALVDPKLAAVPESAKPTEKGPGKKSLITERKKKKKKSMETKVTPSLELKPVVHEPQDVEGTAGFMGRRPIKDPFRVGEKVVHEVTYYGILAGSMTLDVQPFTLVNGRKSYQFGMQAKTRSVFNTMYAAEDSALNLVDYDTLVPSAFFVHIKESKQLKEARGFFDSTKKMATYWEKGKTKDNPEEVKKAEWEIPDFSQNVFSAAFYMRTFDWKEGDEHAFRVADAKENLIFTAKAIRKEKLKTDVGEFDALVIKPVVNLSGVAKPVGDIFIWLSDDDRKYILRIEAKIRIGTLVSEITELDPGPDPQALPSPTPEPTP